MKEIEIILDELIEEARNEPSWKAENALRCIELKYDTFTFISDMMKAEQERRSVNEIMARFFD